MSITLTLVADSADELRLMLLGLVVPAVPDVLASSLNGQDSGPEPDPFDDADRAQVGGVAAPAARPRGRPRKAATNGATPPLDETDPLGGDPVAAAPAAPAVRDPAADLKVALDLLRALYNRRAAQTLVTGLLGKYNVKKFSEITADKGSDLLMDARALDAQTTPPATPAAA